MVGVDVGCFWPLNSLVVLGVGPVSGYRFVARWKFLVLENLMLIE